MEISDTTREFFSMVSAALGHCPLPLCAVASGASLYSLLDASPDESVQSKESEALHSEVWVEVFTIGDHSEGASEPGLPAVRIYLEEPHAIEARIIDGRLELLGELVKEHKGSGLLFIPAQPPYLKLNQAPRRERRKR